MRNKESVFLITPVVSMPRHGCKPPPTAPLGFLTSWFVPSAEGLPLPRGRRRIILHSEEGKDVSVTSPGANCLSYERHFQWVIQITPKGTHLYAEQVLFFVFVPGNKHSIFLVFELRQKAQ